MVYNKENYEFDLGVKGLSAPPFSHRLTTKRGTVITKIFRFRFHLRYLIFFLFQLGGKL